MPERSTLRLGYRGLSPLRSFPGGTSTGNSVLVQPDGKIVLAGTVVSGTTGSFGLARFNADGTPDTTFGTGGDVATQFFTPNGSVVQLAALLQADGRIVLVGAAGDQSTHPEVGLARYNPEGSLDTGFGTGGRVITSIGMSATPRDAVLQPDGKIVVVTSVDGSFDLVRYDMNGTLDSSFGAGGFVAIPFGDHMALQRDGRFLVGSNDAVARYNADGTMDNTFGVTGISVASTEAAPSGGRGFGEVALQPDGKILAVGTQDPFFLVVKSMGVPLIYIGCSRARWTRMPGTSIPAP
jgi:uncharacterized delta-60 repeat protein